MLPSQVSLYPIYAAIIYASLARAKDVTQAVVDSVSKLLDAGDSLPVDPKFLQRREAELVQDVAAAGFRMQHFFQLRAHLLESLAAVRVRIEEGVIDNFLSD